MNNLFHISTNHYNEHWSVFFSEKSDSSCNDLLECRVDFIETPGRPQPPAPPVVEDVEDIAVYLDDVQTPYLPASQIDVVNTSYTKTIGEF